MTSPRVRIYTIAEGTLLMYLREVALSRANSACAVVHSEYPSLRVVGPLQKPGLKFDHRTNRLTLCLLLLNDSSAHDAVARKLENLVNATTLKPL